jgi:hypothetical protein
MEQFGGSTQAKHHKNDYFSKSGHFSWVKNNESP